MTVFKVFSVRYVFLTFYETINYDDQSLFLEILKSSIDDAIDSLKKDVNHFQDSIDYISYADTFIIYSKATETTGYPELVRTSKNFINTCIYKRLPIRGAISYGELILGHDNKILMGKALLESYEYGEDQNWIGLLLTPSASKQLKSINLDPIRHGFINQDIPLRRFSIFDDNIYAYCFINGSTNYECPLLSILKEMYQKASDKEKIKYLNTIKFIGKHYTVHSTTKRRS